MKLFKEDIVCIQYVKTLIDKDPTQHSRLQDLADATAISRNKLIYGFKQLYDISVHAYCVQKRMATARELLENSEKPIKEIARLTQYKDSTTFGRVFKKVFGLTPSAWRRQQTDLVAV